MNCIVCHHCLSKCDYFPRIISNYQHTGLIDFHDLQLDECIEATVIYQKRSAAIYQRIFCTIYLSRVQHENQSK